MSPEFSNYLEELKPVNPAMVEAVMQGYGILCEGMWDTIKGVGKAAKDFAFDYVGAENKKHSSGDSLNINPSNVSNLREKAGSVLKGAGKAAGTLGAAFALAACAGNNALHADQSYAQELNEKYGNEINVNAQMTPDEINRLAYNLVSKMKDEILDAEDYSVKNTAAYKDASKIAIAMTAVNQSQGDKFAMTVNSMLNSNLKVLSPDIRDTSTDEERSARNKEKKVESKPQEVRQDENGNYIYGANDGNEFKAGNLSLSNTQEEQKPTKEFAKINNFSTRTGEFEG